MAVALTMTGQLYVTYVVSYNLLRVACVEF